MGEYYSKALSARRLKKCYDIAPKRTKQYLEAEISHILTRINTWDSILELGCGYGRVLKRIANSCTKVTGIDISLDSLKLAFCESQSMRNMELLQADAGTLPFPDGQFDVVLCIQNGISAFKLDPTELMKEGVRITRKGGLCLFSSYSEKFWKDRLEWFKVQSEQGLIGRIDWEETRDGVIVCEDGFRATTYTPRDFKALTTKLGIKGRLVEVDNSSLFCEILVK
ncbi:MAG: class I SAM-dependent methyltransferase [Candidatus Thorarchaeota archaeon]|nr:class I SAM-dependent methyltransferase [Candidatus Thorarchaeota archaeon]